MIVIICDSYREAMISYNYFLMMIEMTGPCSIVSSNDASLSVTTDDDLTYIFCDYHLKPYFSRLTPDIIESAEFFCDLWEGDFN